jgi:hypothetical protein
MDTWNTNSRDIDILRQLYRRQCEIAQDPIMEARKRLWREHASLKSLRPMFLAETQGVLDELVPLASLQCQEPWARDLERGLRDLIFRYEHVRDDYVVEPWINIAWAVTAGDYGVEVAKVRASNDGRLGSYHWDPPIKDLDSDFDRLHIRSHRVNREKTHAWKAFVEEHFGDLLPVRIRASYWWTTGLTWTAIDLIGMEMLMTAMYDNPAGLHRLMAFLRDDMLYCLDWFEREGLLTPNNENDYVGSGGIGYTTALPQPDLQPEEPARLRDLWGLCESQETVGVSPAMFEEFVFPYQAPIISRFGLSYYGCCEPVHNRIQIIKRLPNLRSLSVSPWCNQEIMARELGGNYIFCRKPNPAIISTARFDEEAIREDIRATLRAAGGVCPLEFAMKDVHTLNDEPLRLGRWVDLAREVSAEFGFA